MAGGVKLTTLLHTVPRLGVRRYTATVPLRLHALDRGNFNFDTKTNVHLGRTLPFGFLLKPYDVLQFRSNFEKKNPIDRRL